MIAEVDLSGAAKTLDGMLEANLGTMPTLRVLWALDVIGWLSRTQIASLLESHADEHVRAAAVRLLVEHPDHVRNSADDVAWLTRAATDDKSGLVRLAIASALVRFTPEDRLPIARALARHAEDAADRRQPLMIWYGLEPCVPLHPQAALEIAAETPMLSLAGFIARRVTHDLDTRPDGAAQLVQLLQRLDASQDERRLRLLAGMTAALQGWRKAQPPVGWEQAAASLAASQSPETVRLTRELSVVFGDGPHHGRTPRHRRRRQCRRRSPPIRRAIARCRPSGQPRTIA